MGEGIARRRAGRGVGNPAAGQAARLRARVHLGDLASAETVAAALVDERSARAREAAAAGRVLAGEVAGAGEILRRVDDQDATEARGADENDEDGAVLPELSHAKASLSRPAPPPRQKSESADGRTRRRFATC